MAFVNGDGVTMLDGCTLVLDEVALENQVLINYIIGILGGVIGEEYADPYGEGRIVAVEAPTVKCTPCQGQF